jgi:hypothetical protein
MPRHTKLLKPCQPKKNKAAVHTFQPLSPFQAFKAIVKQSERLSSTTFCYSEGIGVYWLFVYEGTVRLECRVGRVRAYVRSYQIGELHHEYADQILAILKTRKVNREVRAPADTVTLLKMGNETARDRAAAQKFREATRSQVHVMSRRPSSDMLLGHTPGHIGDLK